MKRSLVIFTVTVFPCLLAVTGITNRAASEQTGKELFELNCAVCHPYGGNIMNPAMTLQEKDREANGVTQPADIIATMRNPGPGMTKFDEKAIPDQDAKKIAEYILKAF